MGYFIYSGSQLQACYLTKDIHSTQNLMYLDCVSPKGYRLIKSAERNSTWDSAHKKSWCPLLYVDKSMSVTYAVPE